MNLAGKNILVTGGAIRVGAGICRALARRGATVAIHCRNSRAAAEALADALPGAGHRVVAADFAVPGAAEALAEEAGELDGLVNNASLYEPGALHDADPESDRRHFEVNFFAPLALIRAFAARHPRGGAVVNVLDQEVFASAPSGGAYSLSRRALADATLELARELGPRNLRVNAVAPGPMIPPPQFADSGMKKTLPALPLGRKVEVEDLAAAVCFLLENDSITGAVLPVDCGEHLGGPK